MDEGKLLSLHGRIGNTPASKVVLVVDDMPPHRIHVRGRVDEKVFKFTDYEVWTEVSTAPKSESLRIDDMLTNHSDYEREYQVVYHGNFGPPRFRRVIAACGVMEDGRPYMRGVVPPGKMAGNLGPDSKMNTALAAHTPDMPWAEINCAGIIDMDGAGTSSATPQIAAAAALWLQHHKSSLTSASRG